MTIDVPRSSSADGRWSRLARPGWRRACAVAALAASGCLSTGDAQSPPVPERPTFSADVAEIVYRECTPCHQPGGPGPFSLRSYDDVRARAALIAQVVGQRRMPPWLPEGGDYAFANDRRLSAREIAILERWAEQGATLGDSLSAPAPPATGDGWVLGTPDLILEMPEAYTVPAAEAHAHGAAGHHDSFRNFVIRVPGSETRYVRALEFRHSGAGVVHHAVMSIDPTPGSRERDARDAEPGFDGMLERSAARPPGGFFTVWIPGSVPRFNPDGLAWPLEPGTDLVIQAHLRPTDEPADVRLSVGLHFGEQPSERSPLIVYLLGRTIDIPAGVSDYPVADSFRLPVDTEILGLYPHAHYLARTMEVNATLPDGTQRTLLRIGQWDFNWQDTYPFESPVLLPAGTLLRMRYVYDNSSTNPRNPAQPPRRVTLGSNSTDEMGELWIQARPRNPTELAALEESTNRKAVADMLEMQRFLVGLHPDDPSIHAALAAVHDARGDIEAGIEHYRRAVELDPDFEQAQYNLALLLEARGDARGGERHYREAIRAFPEFADAHNNLGSLLSRSARVEEAERHFRRAVEIDPRHAGAHVNLGSLARARGRIDEAVGHYRRALEAARGRSGLPFQPADLRFNLALLLLLGGEPDEALEHLAEGARLAPANFSPRIAAGWMLATHPDASLRRPADALRLGEEIRAAMGGDDAQVLDLLAAAHAAAGRFDRATALGENAQRLATAAGERELAEEIGQRLALYRQHRPFIARRP